MTLPMKTSLFVKRRPVSAFVSYISDLSVIVATIYVTTWNIRNNKTKSCTKSWPSLCRKGGRVAPVWWRGKFWRVAMCYFLVAFFRAKPQSVNFWSPFAKESGNFLTQQVEVEIETHSACIQLFTLSSFVSSLFALIFATSWLVASLHLLECMFSCVLRHVHSVCPQFVLLFSFAVFGAGDSVQEASTRMWIWSNELIFKAAFEVAEYEDLYAASYLPLCIFLLLSRGVIALMSSYVNIQYSDSVQLYKCIFTMHIHIHIMIVIPDLLGLLGVLAAAVVVVVEEEEVVVEVAIMVKQFVVASNLVLCFWLAASLSCPGRRRASHLEGITFTGQTESKFMHVCVWHMLSLTPKISFWNLDSRSAFANCGVRLGILGRLSSRHKKHDQHLSPFSQSG